MISSRSALSGQRQPARVDRTQQVVERPGIEHVVWVSSPARLRVALSGSPGVGCHADASPDACQFLDVLRELTCQTVAVRDLFKTPEERGARGLTPG